MRRAGKTWFLYQQMHDRVAQGRPRESLVYFNFEDERLAGMESTQLSWLVDEYYAQFPERRDSELVTFLLDEIQVVPGWERFVRRILDSEKVEVFVSGSSARLLSREVATSLRGRATETIIHPYSFREFLSVRGLDAPLKPDFLPKKQISLLESALREYLEVGGFPEAQGLTERDRLSLLQGYVDSAILRDIVERYQVSNVVALRRLVRQLLGSAGGRFSVHRFYNDLKSQGVSVSKQTLHEMLAFLEDAFLVTTLPIATTSERRRQSNPRKVYPLDPALVQAFDRSGKSNLGSRLETVVALELSRRSEEQGYYDTAAGFEVDFLAQLRDKRTLLVQVCASLADPSIRKRELRALEQAREELPGAETVLLTLDTPDAVQGVSVLPVWRWLLESGAA